MRNKFEVYDNNGYLNVKSIANVKGLYFYILIGSRQIGKTYGTLKYLIETGEPFFYVRRTSTELESCADNPDLNPFTEINKDCGYNIYFERADKKTFNIMSDSGDGEPVNIGIATSLSAVATIRGFSGARYKYIVYDEFIPESHIRKIKNEGDAVINLYLTVSGNRELRGDDPVKMFLLANANDLNSPVLESLNVTDKIDMMIRRKQEFSILKNANAFILVSNSSPIADKRRNMAIYRLIDEESEVYKMTIENEFSYNDRSDVTPRNAKNYTPVLRTIKNGRTFFTVGRNSEGRYYVHNINQTAQTEIELNDAGKILFSNLYRWLYREFIRGNIDFSTYRIRRDFLTLFR